MNHERAFGDLLRSERIRANRTLADVSDVLGLSIAYMSDIERGKRRPPEEERIRRIAKFLNSNAEVLLRAAAQVRGCVELEFTGSDKARDELATSLARTWASLSPTAIERIQKALRDAGQDGKK